MLKKVFRKLLLFGTFLCLFSLASYGQKMLPFGCGPALEQNTIEKRYLPMLEIFDLSEGDTFADVGSFSGTFEVMLSTLVEGVDFYIQDVDSSCLNQETLAQIIDYYSEQSGQNLREKNSFQITYGTFTETKLPNETFDVIYTNFTFHVFDNKEEMMYDMHQKLKADGKLFLRDGIAKPHKLSYCDDPNCTNPVATEQELLEIAAKAGFQLVEKFKKIEGFPMYQFEKTN